MGSRESKQVSDDELKDVFGGIGFGFGRRKKGIQKHCPICGSVNVVQHRVGKGFQERMMGRCKDCQCEAGWGQFY